MQHHNSLHIAPIKDFFSFFNSDLLVKSSEYSKCLSQSFTDISPFFDAFESKDKYCCFSNETNQPFLNPNCVRDFVIEENYNFSSKPAKIEEDQNPQELSLQRAVSEETECLTPNSMSTNTSTMLNVSDSDGFMEKWGAKEKYVQNPRKNVPGLVVQRLRSSIFTLLDAQRRTTNKRTNENLSYIQKILTNYNDHDIENMKSILSSYNKNWKTWKMIGEFVNKDEVFAKMLKEIIEAFLGSEGSEDFKEWIDHGKMNEHTKEVIQTSREWMIEKFAKMFNETEKKDRKKKSKNSKRQKH